MTKISIQKFLLKQVSQKKLALSFLGLTLGLVAVVFCIQLFSDVEEILGEQKAKGKHEYLQVNKKIGYGNVFGLSSSNFSETEINSIKRQDFITDAGKVLANNFQVSIQGGIGIPFYTDLFLQGVSNKFLDIDTSGFSWDESSEEVPIVVSTHFYNLYNHGFAPSQGLPSLPKSALKQKSFTLKIKGERGAKALRCRIYGYSDRITSILVPLEFLNWANETYSESQKEEVSMLILEVEDAGDTRLAKYLEQKSYAVNKEQLSLDNTKLILKSVLYVFGILGFIIVLLSVLNLLSFSKLIIAQNKQELSILLLMGYSKKRMATELFKAYVNYLSFSILSTLIILAFSCYFLYSFLLSFNFNVSYFSRYSALGFIVLVTSISCLIYVNIFRYLKNSKSIEI